MERTVEERQFLPDEELYKPENADVVAALWVRGILTLEAICDGWAVSEEDARQRLYGVRYPDVTATLGDGNVFAVIGRVSAALKRAGEPEAAREFANRAVASDSYDEVLRLAMETVNIELEDE